MLCEYFLSEGFQREASLWRDARAVPLDGLIRKTQIIQWMIWVFLSGSRLRCAEGETLAGGSKGAKPIWQV